MIEVGDLKAFVAVVRAGSFTGAARVLGTQTAHLSRVVSRLEDRVRVRLLQRSTRSLALTEAGRELFERALGILDALETTEAALLAVQAEPQGTLRLTCGIEFGILAVNAWIANYLQRYPAMRVEADMTNRLVDIVHEGVDVAIRVGPLADSALSGRKLGDVEYGLYASPEYLADRPPLASPAELDAHDLVAFVSTSPIAQRWGGWQLYRGDERIDVGAPPRVLVNNNIAARDAAAAGYGISLLPSFQVAPLVASGALVQVLPAWTRPPVPVHAVFASSRYLSPKVRAFVNLARESFGGQVAPDAEFPSG
jgi:DNA-binding transcriptional LysR family regulator